MILRMVDDVPHGTIKFRISRKIGFCNAFSVDDFSPGEGQDFFGIRQHLRKSAKSEPP
jgi:hypothetical protein